MGLRCLLVDDSRHFLDAASTLLERQGIGVVGAASTGDEAVASVRELRPDVTLVDVDLGHESGLDVARRLAEASDEAPTRTILTSTHAAADFAQLVAVTPVLGFIAKNELSARAIHDLLADRDHGHGCRHEALVYSTADQLAAGAVPFIRAGLAGGDQVLVVMREPGRAVLEEALEGDAAEVEFADATEWYRSPQHAFEQYSRYVDDHLRRGAPRVRVVAEVVWPESSAAVAVGEWKRYEAEIGVALAPVPASFMCAYDTRELPAEIVSAARRTHPILRTPDGARPSAAYVEPVAFVRELERELPELARGRPG